MKIGAFVGKFYPPHIGHLSAIDFACTKLDLVYVIISKNQERENQIKESSGFDYLPAELIKSWFEDYYKNNSKVKVEIFDEQGLLPYPNDQDKWAKRFKEQFPFVNVKIADIGYKEFNQKYFPDYEFLAIDREKIDIHSSYFRKNPKKYINFLIPKAQSYFLDIIKKEKNNG